MRILIFLLATLPSLSFAFNLHLIDQNRESGFSIYRTGRPTAQDIDVLCKKGIEEIAVLSGDASKVEERFKSRCPGLKVVYNKKQKAKLPLTQEFLSWFDNWVEDAKRTGKKIAFRCVCGCHRTGRLAAYYQMKYQNLTPYDAITIMKKHGKLMVFYKFLDAQVFALSDYIEGKQCTQDASSCVR